MKSACKEIQIKREQVESGCIALIARMAMARKQRKLVCTLRHVLASSTSCMPNTFLLSQCRCLFSFFFFLMRIKFNKTEQHTLSFSLVRLHSFDFVSIENLLFKNSIAMAPWHATVYFANFFFLSLQLKKAKNDSKCEAADVGLSVFPSFLPQLFQQRYSFKAQKI